MNFEEGAQFWYKCDSQPVQNYAFIYNLYI